ncbi:MAG TPA: hypothetical protein VGD65_00090 [Chryseosolibacter sp.]
MDTLNQKVSHLNALYHLASADSDISEVELVYIRKVAERFGVNLEEVTLNSAEPELDLPNREYKVYTIFHRLALILMIDNESTEAERSYCFNLGIRMGLHPNAVQEIIAFVTAHGSLNTTPQAVMAIFRKYLS